MTASRRLYNAMAVELRKVAPLLVANDERDAWADTVFAVAKGFKADNSGFDSLRFFRASGFTDDELLACIGRV